MNEAGHAYSTGLDQRRVWSDATAVDTGSRTGGALVRPQGLPDTGGLGGCRRAPAAAAHRLSPGEGTRALGGRDTQSCTLSRGWCCKYAFPVVRSGHAGRSCSPRGPIAGERASCSYRWRPSVCRGTASGGTGCDGRGQPEPAGPAPHAFFAQSASPRGEGAGPTAISTLHPDTDRCAPPNSTAGETAEV